MNYSIVQFIPERNGHSCGYCKSQDGSMSEGMWAHSLTVQDYQELIDRGWRRSGLYCYKPIMNVTCCPAYTIRCAALDFQLTKSQKKKLKRMRKFLIDGLKNNIENAKDSFENSEDRMEVTSEMVGLEKIPKVLSDIDIKDVDTSMLKGSEYENFIFQNTDESTTSISQGQDSNCDVLSSGHDTTNVNTNTSHPSKEKKTPLSAEGRDTSRPLMKKAKLIRLERLKKKLIAKGNSQCGDTISCNASCKKNESGSKSKTLEEFLDEPLPKSRKHNLEIRLVNMNHHSEELFTQEHLLFQKYQMVIHKDPLEKCTAAKFKRFLIQSPLKLKQDSTITDISYGSFHQQYWLDEKLIAVGVIDILPYCVSSVYFFYDPDYSFLSLGTYSSLREVAFVRSLCSKISQLKYYYMGFYIHSCPKMKYKGRMSPSFILCPEIYSWHPIQMCISKFDENKYSRINDDPNAISQNSDIEFNKVLILWKNITIDYGRFKRLCKKKINPNEILHYAQLVGKTCSQRMLLYQNTD